MQNNTKPYLEAIKALWELIDSDYDDGGWLPPGRQMAQQLGISHATYRKALKFIEDEAIVQSCPPKGHYVNPLRVRVRKIGLIIANGVESPFVHGSNLIASILQHLYDNGFSTHFIQAASIGQLYDNAVIHAPKGLIWLDPPSQALETVQKLNKEKKLPLVVIQTGGTEFNFCKGYVIYDAKHIVKQRVEFLLGRGHKHIGYIGAFKSAKNSGMVDVLLKNGCEFTSENCVGNIMNSPEKVLDMVLDKNVTAIMSEGGTTVIDLLFSRLSELPDNKQPEVMIPKYKEFCRIKSFYPKIKLIDTSEFVLKNDLGLEAAMMITAHLQNKEPLKKVKIRYEN